MVEKLESGDSVDSCIQYDMLITCISSGSGTDISHNTGVEHS